MVWPNGRNTTATTDWATGQFAWQFRSPDKLLRQLQAAASAKAAAPTDLTKSCSDWIGSQLPVDVRRQLNHATNEQRSGHIIAGLILLLALCGWVNDGDDGARRAVMGGVPPAPPQPISPTAMQQRFGARRLSAHEAPQLFNVVQALCRRANMARLPDIYVLPNRHAMNAYAVGGHDGAAITLTEGLLAGMTHIEVGAIIAHEMAHICNDDGWTMSLAASLQRAVASACAAGVTRRSGHQSSAGDGTSGWVLANAPTIAELLCLALSRNRELAADALALELIGDPRALASALEKLERHHGGPSNAIYAHRDGAHLRYLQSHPPTAQRVSYVHGLS